MNRLTRYAAIVSFSIITGVVFASPRNLIMHNHTDLESNAFINGIASPCPTAPHQEVNSVPWAIVKMACKSTTGKCIATIKMATNTSTPFVLGVVELNLATGQVVPDTISANGYTMTAKPYVPGTLDVEATLEKDA